MYHLLQFEYELTSVMHSNVDYRFCQLDASQASDGAKKVNGSQKSEKGEGNKDASQGSEGAKKVTAASLLWFDMGPLYRTWNF